VWDGTKYAAPDTVPGTTGCFKPICNGADLVTVGNGDAMGFLSPDGWFYPARDGHSDCCRRLTLGLKIAVSLRGGPESGLMDEDGWVKFAVYGKQRLHEDEVYSYSAKDKKLSRKQQTFLLAAIKAAREAGWRVSDDFERRVLESNINH
jgi:hypothetical protein